MKKIKIYSVGLFIIGLLTVSLFTFGSKNKSNVVKQDEQPVSLAEYNKKIGRKDKMVLVYFSAHWCQICAKIKPVIDQVESEYNTKLEILRIDTDRDKEVANEFEIDALPVLILYKNGSRIWLHAGLIEKNVLKTKIESY